MRRNILAIRRESSWFSAGDCCAMAASMSKSMPALNALPLPVTMATRAWLFSMWSSAVWSSAIICVEMALRFSGRFSVRVARFPVMSRRSVEYMSETPPQLTSGDVRILRANLVGHFECLGQSRRIYSRISAGFPQRREDVFRRDVPNQIVSRKGTSAKSGQRAVESPATRLVGRENFFLGILGAAVQVHAQLDSRDVILHLAVKVADELRRRRTHRVCQRNGPHANVFQPFERVRNNFRAPRFIVRVSKRHGNVNHEAAIRRCRFFL